MRWYLYGFMAFVGINLIVMLTVHSNNHNSFPPQFGAKPTSARDQRPHYQQRPAHSSSLRSNISASDNNSGQETRKSIPRTVHMTWKTSQVPEWALANVQSWKTLNPDYKWVLHTDAEMDAYVRERHPELVVVWDKLIPIQKADFYR